MNIVGHRGASAARPENTPVAFRTAGEMGADGVELDVRRASDGRGGHRLVVFHDPLPAEQAVLDALVGFDDVLDACGERMLVNVEIKNSADDGGHDPTMAVVGPTIDAMRARGWAGRWLISSFDLATVAHCHDVAPEIPVAFLVHDPSDEAVESALSASAAAIHPWAPMVTAERVDACHAAGLAVNTWTCNDPERIRELAQMGVDGVCTDVPDLALEALGRTDVAAAPSW